MYEPTTFPYEFSDSLRPNPLYVRTYNEGFRSYSTQILIVTSETPLESLDLFSDDCNGRGSSNGTTLSRERDGEGVIIDLATRTDHPDLYLPHTP